ncbi:MFS transporter [Alkalihalobacillus pseudalcaliphilus]|uniref:MFS transporter n=1 Tax=Alkalihalobacillus pseudalcaliphilus TaxID=79884 RepID=UPI00064E0AA8|nr:MFS transporter [Alkalihalobacillus pseudalcaliphilus]KMK76904.1 hypothetical protein AB990_08415 [Alkalihalobacillus pseudalcaliphilus]
MIQEETKSKLWTKGFISIAACVFFIFSTFYVLLVSLPVFILDVRQGTAMEAGLTTTIMLISAIVTRPLAGRMIERFGSKIILLVGVIIFAAMAFLYLVPLSIPGLLVLRFLHGIGFGMVTTAGGAIVADVIPQHRRGEGMGYYVLAMNLGMVIGPFLGISILQNYGEVWLFSVASVLATGAFICSVMLWFTFSEERYVNSESISKKEDIIEKSALRISFIACFFAIVYAGILSFVSVYAIEIGLGSVSGLFFIVYAVILIITRPFTGRIFDRYGANVIVYPCIVFFAVGLFILSISETTVVFLLAAAFIGLGWGTLFPSFQTLAINGAPYHRAGAATATFLSVFDIGVGLGSALLGWVIATIGFETLYMTSAIYVLIGIGLYFGLISKPQAKVRENQQVSKAGLYDEKVQRID